MAGAKSGKRIVQVLSFVALWMAALFGGAGRLSWARGWIYVALYAAGMAATGIAIRRSNPGLMEARAKWRQTDTKRFDRVILSIFVPLTKIQPLVAGLDAVRFHWSSLPPGFILPGVLLHVVGIALVAWTLSVNPFAETTVRIQHDRGHKAIGAGPYRIVRHPMYVGCVFMYLAAPLILGSLWALAVGGCIIVTLVVRTALEDRTLRSELPGYAEYAATTPYRLIPRIW
jgi:protein-S-isoprenylcysteine O-methyltransferase Ste14